MDSLGGAFFLVLGGGLLSIFVGWRMPDPIAEVGAAPRRAGLLRVWRFLLRWIAPSILAVMAYLLGETSYGKFLVLFE